MQMSPQRRTMLKFYFPICFWLIAVSLYYHRPEITLVWTISLISMLTSLRLQELRARREAAEAKQQEERLAAFRPTKQPEPKD